MKKPNFIFAFALAAAALVFAVDSRAENIYEFTFDQSDYFVTEGSTVDISFLLRETVTNGDVARFAVGGGDGLFAFGVNSDFSTVSSGAGSFVASESDVAINAIFNDSAFNDVSFAGSSVDIFGATTNAASGIEIAEISPDVFELTLATITVTAGDLDSVTTFDLADHTNTGAIFSLFADSFVIDTVASYGSANVTVVAVPEPASGLVLLGIAGFGLIRRKR